MDIIENSNTSAQEGQGRLRTNRYIVSLSGATRYIRWPASFTAKGKFNRYDRGYGQAAIIQKDGADVYAVCYGNCHLAGNHLRARKDLGRDFGDLPASGKGGIVTYGKEIPVELKDKHLSGSCLLSSINRKQIYLQLHPPLLQSLSQLL